MRIGVPAETRPGETRVAATPETVKKLAAKNEVRVQAGAGVAASIRDQDYEAAGAKMVASAAEAYDADIVLKVRAPTEAEIGFLKDKSILVGLLDPYDAPGFEAIAKRGVTGFAMELLPRTISRGQAMDVLSSQANIAGYKAVILAAAEMAKYFPMLMTAAGTVKAARVLVLGAGVAGLQAIATAKRLGAVIEASDVRPAVKEQVESLGAKFVDVPYLTDEEREIAEGKGGYARPMPPDWMQRQAQAVHQRATQADVVITNPTHYAVALEYKRESMSAPRVSVNPSGSTIGSKISWSSLVTSSTPCRPRSRSDLKKSRQCTSASESETLTPRMLRRPSGSIPIAVKTAQSTIEPPCRIFS